MNYYNEFDPFAAEWLKALIKKGLIPDGEVDTRSIVDVRPDDLRPFKQCHFFAGIGGWSHALRLAGWADDRQIWTGSCPCQPFSVAGKGKGQSDERHLWPAFFELIRQVRPPVVMGEQVAGKAGYGWFDGVASDLEGEGYSSRAVDIPACSVDAPHLRSRLYWVAQNMDDAASARCGATGREPLGASRDEAWRQGFERRSGDGCSDERGWLGDASGSDMANANGGGCGGRQKTPQWSEERGIIAERVGGCDMADAENGGRQSFEVQRPLHQLTEGGEPPEQRQQFSDNCSGSLRRESFWHDHEWLTGADGKTRRSKPGVRLLVNGLPNRVGLLRGFGNAIVPPLAAEVIRAFMETEG